MSEESPAAFDRAALAEVLGGDEELLRYLVKSFVNASEELLAKLESASAGGDVEALIFLTHKLNGSAGNIRAELLSGASIALERALREGREVDIPATIRELRLRYLEFKEAVRDDF